MFFFKVLLVINGLAIWAEANIRATPFNQAFRRAHLPSDHVFRIIGGREAVPHSKPFVVRLITKTVSASYGCGGSIIDEYNIVTAAHCLEDAYSAKVLAGRHNVMTPELSAQNLKTEDFTVHERYSYATTESQNFDIALVHLHTPLKFNKNVQPAKLIDRLPIKGSRVESIGWGHDETRSHSDVLLTVYNRVLNTKQALKVLGTDAAPEHFICTDMNDKKGTCIGDSGGPLVTASNEVAGVTSFGDPDCFSEKPQCFTSLLYFKDWINKHLKRPRNA